MPDGQEDGRLQPIDAVGNGGIIKFQATKQGDCA